MPRRPSEACGEHWTRLLAVPIEWSTPGVAGRKGWVAQKQHLLEILCSVQKTRFPRKILRAQFHSVP
jgi:hypothetical protein